MTTRLQQIAHTVAALAAAALVILPDVMPLLASYPRASRIVGALLLILTNAKKVPGFAALLARYAASGEKLGPPSNNTPVIKGDA